MNSLERAPLVPSLSYRSSRGSRGGGSSFSETPPPHSRGSGSSRHTSPSEEGSSPTSPQQEGEYGDHGANVLAAAANEILRGAPHIDAPCLLGGRRVCLGGAFALSASAKLAFIPISLQLPAGPLFATCNSLAFLSLEFWAAKAAINEAFGPQTASERALYLRNVSSAEKRSIVILNSIILSLVSQLPSGFAVFHYNSPELRVPAAILSVVANSFFPFRSLQLTLNQVVARQPKAGEEVMLVGIKKKLLSQITLFESARTNGREMLGGEEENDVYHYLAASPLSAETSTVGNSCLDVSAKVLAVALTIFMEYALCMFTFESVKEQIIDEDAVAGVFAAAVVVSTLYLSGNSLVKTSKRIVNFVARREKTAAQKMRPRLVLGLNVVGLAFDGLAIGPTYVIWGDFFEAHPEYGEKDFFQPVLCIAMFLLLYTATSELADEGIESGLLSRGSPREKAEIHRLRTLKKVNRLIEKASLTDLAVFLNSAPERYKETLLEHSGLTSEGLSDYVRGLLETNSEFIRA